MIFLVVMYECEKCITKKAEHQRIWTVVLEKTLDSPLDCKEIIKPVTPEVNQHLVFIGRTDAEAPILWPPEGKSWLFSDPDAGKDWGQEKKGVAEDEMVR